MSDNVNQPSHYTAGDVECIDAIRSALGEAGFRAYCIGNVIKYNWRHARKNGAEDLRKASVYQLWAIHGNPNVKLGAVIPPTDAEGNTAAPPGLSEVAAAGLRHDMERDDDEGAPGEPPRCRSGACD